MAAEFSDPIYIRMNGSAVHEIHGPSDAARFLEQWPTDRRDLVHEVALNVCYDVLSELKPLEAARNALEGFAKRKGVLFTRQTVKEHT